MDIDVDWCLTCQKHIDGSSPYCSLDCAAPSALHNHEYDDSDDDDLMLDAPSSYRSLDIDTAGIAAWAADIPANAPPNVEDVSSPPEQVRTLPARILFRTQRAPPNLLKSSRHAAPPCLSVSNTLPADSSHSSPILTPSRQSSAELRPQPGKSASPSKTSSKSPQTESPVSTPSSSHPQLSGPVRCPSRKSWELDRNEHGWGWGKPEAYVDVHIAEYGPFHKLDSSTKFLMLTTHSPPPPKKPLACVGRGHHRLSELAFNDEPPSFRARGRKASSRAAA